MSVLRIIVQKIPGLVPGIFFFILTGLAMAGPSLELAVDLFEEGDWAAAHTESLRVLTGGPGPLAARASLLSAVSALRMGQGQEKAKADLGALWQDSTIALETRSMAAYELGGAIWGDGDATNTLAALKFAYLNACEPPLFWRAGCSLYFFLKAEKSLRSQESVLWQSLQSCRDIWPLEVWQECRPRRKSGTSLASLPGKWIVKFYRAQISPAIGARCDLLPSCSEYFKQASRAHGLLGISIMADRFIREPSVVSAAEKPVVMPDGHIRFKDPLSDHDSWLR